MLSEVSSGGNPAVRVRQNADSECRGRLPTLPACDALSTIPDAPSQPTPSSQRNPRGASLMRHPDQETIILSWSCRTRKELFARIKSRHVTTASVWLPVFFVAISSEPPAASAASAASAAASIASISIASSACGMRFSHFIICVLLVAAVVSNSFAMAASAHHPKPLTAAQEAKIAASLLQAVRADPQVEANIMVQLESPEEAMHRVCGDDTSTLTRAQKTTCMVDNMQQFADESQKQVRELLQHHEGEYSDSTFFWINNSVSVKKAKGKLVLALAALDTVLEVRSEQIFHTMGSGGAKSDEKPQATAKTFGFGVLH